MSLNKFSQCDFEIFLYMCLHLPLQSVCVFPVVCIFLAFFSFIGRCFEPLSGLWGIVASLYKGPGPRDLEPKLAPTLIVD